MSMTIPGAKVDPKIRYEDRSFQDWQDILSDTFYEAHEDRGWLETLAVITAFHLAIPHVECGIMDQKDRRREVIRRWLIGEPIVVPLKCICG